MALICAISQEVPEHPCVSPVSGAVFERRLIEKLIAENGRDPVNNQPISVEQLIDVKCPPVVRPKPPSATSIPALLKSLQDEWDAVMLYSFSLRQQLQTARQELANTLYQNDAACRVIARLTKELQAAREALATLKPSAAQSQAIGGLSRGDAISQPNATEREVVKTITDNATPSSTAAELVEVGMNEEVISKLQENATQLTAERKRRGRTLPEGLATADSIKNYQVVASHTALHSASQPGITCLDLLRIGGSTTSTVDSDPRVVVTGGVDRAACVFDLRRERVLGTLRGHQKKLTHVLFNHSYTQRARSTDVTDASNLPLQVISASADGSARVWSNSTVGSKVGEFREQHTFKCHTAPVNAISLHPTGDFLLTCASDGAWTLLDITRGSLLKREASSAGGSASDELTCIEFHPDGLIFATGMQSAVVKIWDLKELKNVADFPGHTGRIQSIAFSENGFYLATSAEDATVKLWDLRKLKNFKTLMLPERYNVSQLSFDYSGAFLAVAGRDLRVFEMKQFELVHTFEHHAAPVSAARFGPLASYVVSASLDRSVKLLTTAPH